MPDAAPPALFAPDFALLVSVRGEGNGAVSPLPQNGNSGPLLQFTPLLCAVPES